jgi:hypothetical protein
MNKFLVSMNGPQLYWKFEGSNEGKEDAIFGLHGPWLKYMGNMGTKIYAKFFN